MKKIYMTVLTIVTVVCVIGGSIVHGIGLLTRIRHFVGRHTASESGQIVESGQGRDYDLSPFTSLKLDVGIGDIRLVTGDGYHLTYSGKDSLAPVLKEDGDRLKITQNDRNVRSWFKTDNPLDTENTMVITVPADAKLKDLDAELNMGNFTITGISADDTELSLNMGNLDVMDSSFGKLSVDADLGNVTIRDISADKAEFDASMGNIEAVHIADFRSLDLDADMGNIDLTLDQKLDDLNLALSASLGSVKINGENVSDKKIKNGNGSITVTADASLGSVDIKTAR